MMRKKLTAPLAICTQVKETRINVKMKELNEFINNFDGHQKVTKVQ